MFGYFQGLRARRIAEAWCRTTYPDEPVYSSWVCESEPTRFVVRVFCGVREFDGTRMPPWQNCYIIAVDKTTFAAAPVDNDASYRPVLR